MNFTYPYIYCLRCVYLENVISYRRDVPPMSIKVIGISLGIGTKIVPITEKSLSSILKLLKLK